MRRKFTQFLRVPGTHQPREGRKAELTLESHSGSEPRML